MQITYVQKLNLVSTMSAVRGEVMVLAGIYDSAKGVWENYRDRSSGSHLIEGVAFSNLKTESLKSFGAAVLKLSLNAKGKTLNGYSDEMIVEESERFTSTISRLAAVSDLTFERAFNTIMSTVVGYDQWLVGRANYANNNAFELATLTFAYAVRKHDLCDMDYAEAMLLSDLDETMVSTMFERREVFWNIAMGVVIDRDYLDLFDVLKDIAKMDCTAFNPVS